MKSVYYAFFFSLSLVAMILQQKAQKCKNHIFSGFFRHKVLKCKRHLSACNKKLSMSSLNFVFDQLLYCCTFGAFLYLLKVMPTKMEFRKALQHQ